jgi:phage shock protein PspC (stress-responsive transcriptional regulator)
MNKTVNINLAGIFFHIDEIAYQKLQRYLEAIKRSFTDSQGRNEIISDIEARISELFNERIENEKQVVGVALVDEIITIMGQPEDYLVDDEIFEDIPIREKRSSRKSSPSKKLFRDTDNSYVGGVAAGLSHYLSIDTIWMRLLWLLLAFGSGGTFIFIYLIFWALVPEAITTSEKITMSGDPVNITNIEKKIKDSIDSVVETAKNVDFSKQSEKLKEGLEHVADSISDSVKNVDFQKKGNRLKSGSKNFFETIGDIIMFFLKVFAKLIGIILIISGIAALIALIVAIFSVGVIDAVHFPGVDFVELSNGSGAPIWIISLFLMFTVGIPFFFLFYLGLKILINNLKSIGNVAKYSLLGIWLFSIIGLSVFGINQGLSYKEKASFIKTDVIETLNSNDTIVLKMVQSDFFIEDYNRNFGFQSVYNQEDQKMLMSQGVRLIVRSTTDSVTKIKIEKSAHGMDYPKAKKRAESINYNYTILNKTILLDNYFTIEGIDKIKGQEIKVIVYLPEGALLYADKNTYNYHSNDSKYYDILDNGMEEQYLKIISGDVICLDCNDDYKIKVDLKNESSGLYIDDDGLEIIGEDGSLKIDDEGVKAKSESVIINIDENGIEIITDDN